MKIKIKARWFNGFGSEGNCYYLELPLCGYVYAEEGTKRGYNTPLQAFQRAKRVAKLFKKEVEIIPYCEEY